MRPDGACPDCGQVLELRKPLHPQVGAVAPPDDDHDDARPSAPWHFKVLLVALGAYLAWRGVQGVDWLADRL